MIITSNLLYPITLFYAFCWGSFLNVVAHRLLHDIPFFTYRSQCINCKNTIAWYDLIPILSWILLQGRCRYCRKSISWLYPFIESTTAASFLGLINKLEPVYWFGYGLFFSALVITIRTDLETMFILRYFSLGIIPIGFMLSTLQLLPISLQTSIVGTLFGYIVMWIIQKSYHKYTGIRGLGQGDLELMAGIGSFIGATGCWISLLIGSFLGSFYGIMLLKKPKTSHNRYTKIPFGPFLAIGAIITTILHKPLLQIVFNTI